MRKIASLEVPLKGGRAYPIEIGSGTLREIGKSIRDRFGDAQVCVITDSKVGRLHLPAARQSLERARIEHFVETFPAGEKSKNFDTYRRLIEAIPRKAGLKSIVVLALGGGVVGDMAGFVAATWRRGVPVVQASTTLLSDVDSSVGGKTGIDLARGKNLVGAFHQPSMVVIDVDTLKTLPRRELLAGLAETIKYGMIYDAELFDYIENNLQKILALKPTVMAHIIMRSCSWKAKAVVKDEFDRKGHRAMLNFGHTFGHAVEAATTYGKYLHGEAVGVGMICAADLSERLGLCDPGARGRLEALMKKAGLPTSVKGARMENILSAMKLDKKFGGGKTRFVLCKAVGKAVLFENPDPDLVRAVIQARF